MPVSRTYTKPDDATLRRTLSPMQYQVTQADATEPPFQNAYWNHKEAGVYVDVTTGEPLFSSLDKFDSGTGWPSFVRPIRPEAMRVGEDRSHWMVRTEVRSAAGNAHLGHLFPDGPRPTGMRYCINSAALRFVPASKLVEEGYAELAAAFGVPSTPIEAHTDNACAVPAPGSAPNCETTLETAILAGGCFWGMEDLIRKVPGVLDTDVGYTGGALENPTYTHVKTGKTGHAEALRVVFDPQVISFAELLERWFFRIHDPTTVNRQGNDVGTQYRSAIFPQSPAQEAAAREVIAKVNASGKWPRPVATTIEPAGPFTVAEDFHQDYLEHYPNGYTCHWIRP